MEPTRPTVPRRGHRGLQPLHPRRDRPPRVHGPREEGGGLRRRRRGHRRPADAELRGGAAGVADRRAAQDRVRHRAVAAGQRQHQGLPRAPGRAPAPASCPAILVIHENRGLNPHIEDVARRFALENFMAFAPDGLTSVGGYPGDDEKGGAAVRQGRSRQDGARTSYAAAVWLKARPDSTGKLGVTGFCFGGGISNTLAVRMGADLAAAAPFYGGAPPAADVPKIKAAVLVHHGSEDTRLVDGVAGVRGGAEGGRRHARGAHLSGRRARLQQRRHAGALQQGGGRPGVEAHDRLVQQVRAGLTRRPGVHRDGSPRLRRATDTLRHREWLDRETGLARETRSGGNPHRLEARALRIAIVARMLERARRGIYLPLLAAASSARAALRMFLIA